jgi:hypothetical protein
MVMVFISIKQALLISKIFKTASLKTAVKIHLLPNNFKEILVIALKLVLNLSLLSVIKQNITEVVSVIHTSNLPYISCKIIKDNQLSRRQQT